MHARRHLPALALVMPHPELPTTSPCTPRACTPSTPLTVPKQLMASPRTSLDSWGSSSGLAEEDVEYEWTPEQFSLLSRTLDALPSHLYTPFAGSIPPSNLLDKIARSICRAKGIEWPHSTRQTRVKLVEIVRGKNKENVHMTIDEADEDVDRQDEECPMAKPSKRTALYRQSSMDFLPSKGKDVGNLTRLSNRLQRADRFIPIYHPYARPTGSRSPSPIKMQKDAYPFPSSISTRTRSATVSTRSTVLQPQRPLMLRRTASTLSNPMSDISMASVSTGSDKISKPALPKRADSFSVAEAHPTLKRAPSYGTMEVDSPVEIEDLKKSTRTRIKVTEEKDAETRRKRARSRSATASPVSESPDRKKTRKSRDAKEKDVKDSSKSSRSTSSPKSPSRSRSSTAMNPTISSAAKQQAPVATRTSTRTRTSSSTSNMFGPPLPAAQPPTVLPTSLPPPSISIASETRTVTHSASTTGFNTSKQASSSSNASNTKQRTLRRVRTTAFPIQSAAKSSMFSSLFAKVDEEIAAERKQAVSSGGLLGAAFSLA